MIKVAFYKSNYKWWSVLIKWWTKSKYSHCEFYVGDCSLVGISTEQRVRKKIQQLNPKKWDLVELNTKDFTTDDIEQFFKLTQGAKYDWKGIILSQIFARKQDNENKYTCSEWVIECLDRKLNLIYPKNYISITPQDVYNILESKELIK